MANYIGWILTNKGRELLAKAINNETKINITKFKIGAGYNTGNDRELIDLLDKRNEFPVNSYERKENGIVEFTFIVSNKTGSGASTITNSYKISEMGIYAQDDSGIEILYAYNKGTDGDYIPVYNGKNAIDIVEKCIIIIDQAATLNVVIDNSMTYLTREVADKSYLEISALEKIIGLEFGGNIQDIGNKIKGKFYYDNVTKFYYECIENTDLTYNESSKFRAVSNKPNVDKLENLFSFGNGWVKFSFGLIIQWGDSVAQNGNSYVNLPTRFKNRNYQIVTSDTGGGAHRTGAAPVDEGKFEIFGRDSSGELRTTGIRWQAIGF